MCDLLQNDLTFGWLDVKFSILTQVQGWSYFLDWNIVGESTNFRIFCAVASKACVLTCMSYTMFKAHPWC